MTVGERQPRPRMFRAGIVVASLLTGLAAQPLVLPSFGTGETAVATAQTLNGRASDVHVDLTESVGAEWFGKIGDRKLVLSRINGVSTRDLPALDVPRLLKDSPKDFVRIDEALTADGKATFRGVKPGVYLIDIADNPGSQDPSVSYAPFVIAITGDGEEHRVELKAQVLNVSMIPRTSCLVPGEHYAVAPGGVVKYEISAATPNTSTDGSIGHYRLTTELSDMHEAQEGDTDPAQPEPATYVEVESVRLVGAGEVLELDAKSYTVEKKKGSVTIELKKEALDKLAQLRELDPNTAVKVTLRSQARQDATGELRATTTLATDGMDAQRGEVEASASANVPIYKFESCFPPSESSTTTSKPTPAVTQHTEPEPSASAPSTSRPSAEPEEPGSSQPRPERPSDIPGFPTPSDEDGHTGPLTPQEGDPETSDEPREHGGIVSSLASTGASVIGVTVLAVLLILVGIILLIRRRDDEEDSATAAEKDEG